MINSFFQLLVTAFLCACLACVLFGFSTIRDGMTNTQKRAYNALVTLFSMLVGLNLASSLKGYAQMMRWRFLASEYRTLQDFELVMQCESQTKVFRLIWAGRTRGRFWPNGVQILAFLWILINIALQVVTALLGLTYSINISDNFIHWKAHSNVSISYMHAIEPYLPADSIGDFDAQSKYAQSLGNTGSNYLTSVSTLDNDLFGGTEQYYQNEAGTLYWYRFIDNNPEDLSSTVISDRTITTNATCKQYKVTYGGNAGFDDRYDGYVGYKDDAGNDQYLYVPIAVSATGGTTWMAQNVTTCGKRCATLWGLQSADNTTHVPKPQLWQCNNTISHVNGWQTYGSALDYDLPDAQARIFGGALGWTGVNTSDSNNLQYQLYEYPQFPAPAGGQTEFYMSQVVMWYTAGAMAAYDWDGARINETNAYQPNKAQVVDVQWNWAATILAVIPGVQGLLLLCIARWANHAVIKDTSFLSTARLLRPIVDKLGPNGCLLTGDEICEALGNYRVIYGARVPDGTADGDREMVMKHLDLIEEDEGLGKWEGRMPGGRYNGIGGVRKSKTWCEKEAEMGETAMEQKKKNRRLWRQQKRRQSF